jgi:hypothetical protein
MIRTAISAAAVVSGSEITTNHTAHCAALDISRRRYLDF